jgi:hypothetical protein
MRYRFTTPGAILRVDARDVASMASVPHLQRVDVNDLQIPESTRSR